MKVFKFGGASVKDAAGVKNILRVLRHTGFKDTLIVVSAMGKTTNALEQVVHSFFENKEQFPQDLQKVGEDHHLICLLYTSPSPRDGLLSRMPSSA